MRHEWVDTSGNDRPFRRFRRCGNCNVEQELDTEYNWMRVTGYRWLPLVGRCKPEGAPMDKQPPEILDKIADAVLNYRPKAKKKKPRKRKKVRRAKQSGKK